MQKNAFRTEIEIPQSKVKITLKNKILTVGSCFSDSIGRQFEKFKFDALANPFGTSYNPISIFNSLTSAGINGNKYVESRGMIFHHDFHSEFRASDQTQLENQLQEKKAAVIQHLKETNWLIITLGTAWVYELISSGEIVNNCHKVPQKEFSKRLLGMKEMAVAMDETIGQLKEINPNLNIILTVSPVRHTKDGLSENQLSKSMLRVLCDFSVSTHAHVHYFPSYEIMMDDFRDYRFYQDDLIHPTPFAEQYIWEKFQSTYFDQDTIQFIQDWKYIISAMEHRPFNPQSAEHIKFVNAQIDKLHSMADKVSVEEEVAFFERQLK